MPDAAAPTVASGRLSCSSLRASRPSRLGPSAPSAPSTHATADEVRLRAARARAVRSAQCKGQEQRQAEDAKEAPGACENARGGVCGGRKKWLRLGEVSGETGCCQDTGHTTGGEARRLLHCLRQAALMVYYMYM